MIYTIYSSLTGQISRIVTCINIQDQLSENELFLEGSFSDTEYEVVSGTVVLKKKIEISFEEEARNVRRERNRRLSQCDWTQTPDNQLSADEREKWRVYRGKLRGIPEQSGFPFAVIWPQK